MREWIIYSLLLGKRCTTRRHGVGGRSIDCSTHIYESQQEKHRGGGGYEVVETQHTSAKVALERPVATAVVLPFPLCLTSG